MKALSAGPHTETEKGKEMDDKGERGEAKSSQDEIRVLHNVAVMLSTMGLGPELA